MAAATGSDVVLVSTPVSPFQKANCYNWAVSDYGQRPRFGLAV